MFSIVVNEKGGEQKRLEFDKPEVTIGRVQGNDIILPKGNVSKRHSRIVLKDGKFIIVDLKSTNGTYVNGRKITSPLVVKSSDKIYIGDFILSIEEQASAGASMADDPVPTAPPRAKQPSMPPPPPRRAPPPDYADGATPPPGGADAGTDHASADADAEDDAPPPRPARPSTPAVAPNPLPPPAQRVTAPREAVRPPPSQRDVPAAPAPRPAVAAPPPAARPAPAPTPAPAAARPAAAAAPAARPAPAPVRKPASAPAVDDGKRGKITEVMRELSARLSASLGLEGRGNDATAEEDLWSRAERTASDLMDQLNADGAIPPGVDSEQLLRDVVAETVGIGPLEELLTDEGVREVSVPRHDRVFIDRGGQRQVSPRWFSSADAVGRAVERLLARAGRTQDLQTARGNGALVEVRIEGGLLLTAALPPLAARGPSLTIRRPRRNSGRVADLVGEGLMSQGMADVLELAVRNRRNIVVSGPAGSGRSTVLAALARAAGDERIVSVEEAEELELGDGAWIPLIGRGAQARQAIGYALRLKPERLVVGDVRGAEALDVVSALAGGTDGAMFVVQAGSARDALVRLEAMARMAAEAPGTGALNAEIGRGVQVVVHLTRTAEGELRVGEIAEVTAGTDGPVLHTVFSFRPDAAGGRFAASGHIPAWAEGAPPSTFRA